jgi:hypothetical protein
MALNESNGASAKSDEKMEVDVQSQSIAKRKLLTQVNQFYVENFCFDCI